MDLKSYYDDVRKVELSLEANAQDGVVYVTSLYHRERNSTGGQTTSATLRNAARVITDNTHRLATPEEVESFLRIQENNRVRTTKSEQARKQQYIVVVDQHQASEALPPVPPSALKAPAAKVSEVAAK